MSSDRQHELAVFAFDLLYHGGEDLRQTPLIDRRLQLTELVARSSVRCLHLVWRFDDGAKLLQAFRSARRRPTVRAHSAIG
jgi:ATP-dependent DNA ligase